MCGIAGFARWAGGTPERLDAMCGAIRQRGPDDQGVYHNGEIGLGMRRLSIIDVGGGHQPIPNERETMQIVFNGEIYNHRALRNQLQSAGHAYRTSSDTESILHGYESWGLDVVQRLRGMFSIAIWDGEKNRLVLARDRLGIKPLYIAERGDGLAFASELRSLLALGIEPRVNPRAMASYLSYGYVPDPEAALVGVRKLPPGTLLTWDANTGRIEEKKYWDAATIPELQISEADAIDQLRVLLDDAVASHLESEVPLGAMLSGGIDSSAVVALMARHSVRRVRTFSIGFREAQYNEAGDAAEVAKALGTEHMELIVDPNADELIDDLAAAFDEPFGDSSALPTYLVCHLARQHVTVALSGDGGDELFGGYTRYAELARRGALPRMVRPLVRAAARMLPHGTLGRQRLLDLSRSREGRYASTVLSAPHVDDGGLLRHDVIAEGLDLDAVLRPLFDAAGQRDALTQLSLVDLATYLPGDILTKVDRASMAVSLEARPPLLDHPLVEFAIGLPGSMKLRDGTGKWILRRAIEGIVPPRVLEKKKQGFALPVTDWFRGSLKHRMDGLVDRDSPAFQFADATAVRRLVREHLSGRRSHSGQLWRVLMLDLWLRALDRGAIGCPVPSSLSATASSAAAA